MAILSSGNTSGATPPSGSTSNPNTARMPRVVLMNTDTTEELVCQYNPEEVKEKLAIDFNDPEVLGLSHSPEQYKRTQNHNVKLDFWWDALAGEGSPERLDDARRFILSLAYARRGASDVLTGGPSRALFLWPALFALTVSIRSIETEMKRFNVAGQATLLKAAIEFQESRRRRLFSEDVRAKGTIRAE